MGDSMINKNNDLEIIRDLAKRQYEISQLPTMQKLKKEWINHNSLRGTRPIITIEVNTFANEVISPLLNCVNEDFRDIEFELYKNIVNYELFSDDTVVKDYFPVICYPEFKPFDIDVQTQKSEGIGHHFIEQITDLENDFSKLKRSSFISHKKEAVGRASYIEELLGDILPVKITGVSIFATPTQNLVHLMNMETIFYSMHDYPKLFKQMMDNLSNDYLELFAYMEKEKLVFSTNDGEILGNGSYCYNDELPVKDNLSVEDVWGFMDSQETVGVSPEMFEEFIFPYYKKISDKFGLLSYGCCEPIDPIWKNCISKLDNLRKLSISAWCNEEYMGDQLQNRNIIYHRKPSANYIGLGNVLDEQGVAKHIAKTVAAARGCKLEISQRDVYTINHDISKVKRYVEIIRNECEKHY